MQRLALDLHSDYSSKNTSQLAVTTVTTVYCLKSSRSFANPEQSLGELTERRLYRVPTHQYCWYRDLHVTVEPGYTYSSASEALGSILFTRGGILRSKQN